MTDAHDYVMRNCGSFMDNGSVGYYLVRYDPDGMEGFGLAEWSPDIAKALHFPTAVDVIQCWRQRSTVRPARDDGKPNRPLTAYSIEPVPLTAKGEPRFPSMFQREET